MHESNNQKKASQAFLPSEFTEKAFLFLPDRSKTVIVKRFNLNDEGERTLEEIGGLFKITRERVRQIEKGAIAKIKEAKAKEIFEFKSIFQNIIDISGGVAEYDFFLEKAIDSIEQSSGGKIKDRQAEKRHLVLIISLIDGIISGLKNKKYNHILYFNEKSIEHAFLAIEESIKIFEKEKRSMSFRDIFGAIRENQALREKNINLTEQELRSYFEISSEISADFCGWLGLKSWRFVRPRSMRDKAYLILFHKKGPFHFKKITELINETWVKKKKPALAETVHNELIKDKRFVLVGRGVYALAERGYKKGTVQEVIKNILAEKEQPMKKEDIIKEVLAQRIVKTSTIILNLKNKNFFIETEEGMYKLKM